MSTQIFLHLPVKDLDRSVEFFTKLGYGFNPDMSGDKAACMIISENIIVMLLVEELFVSFTRTGVCDTSKGSEMIIAVSADSREKVDEMIRNVIKAGGTVPNEKQDSGWMYSHGFHDLDGHIWDSVYMDTAAIPQNATVAQLQWELRRTY
jgi:predicted lactoylglutathione lyase